MAPLKINNRDARCLWLTTQGLATPPTGKLNVLAIIQQLGFVQLDTIRVIARAHDHIIWSRNQHYREPMLNQLLAKERSVFEHFTHDASILPMACYPMWQRQFKRLQRRIDNSKYFAAMQEHGTTIKARITDEGPLSTHAFDTKITGKKEMWARPPHKLALDYMWYAGQLATAHREDFKKFYDLTERVIPAEIRHHNPSDLAQIDWLCSQALDRLGFATLGEIQRFWDATDQSEVKGWLEQAQQSVVPVEIEGADGTWSSAVAPGNIEARLADLGTPTSRLRIINPFDPVIRDRSRLKRLFGFDYKIEIFVPAAKRKWGYYVLPILEKDRFVGRIEAKADRKRATLDIFNFWLEPKVKWTNRRLEKLDAELARLARFVSLDIINWHCKRPSTEGAANLAQ